MSERGRRTVIAILLLSLTLLSGCWNRRETANMAIVGAIALDQMEENKILVSAEILNPMMLALGTAVASGKDQPVAWIMREESSTVSNALANMGRRSPRKLFVGQVSTIVFGQNLARAGIAPHLDYFARQNEYRRTVLVNICDTATGLLHRPYIEAVPSLTLEGLSSTAAASGRTTVVSLNEFLMKLAEPGIEPIAMHTAGRKTEDLIIKTMGEQVEQDRPAEVRRQPADTDHNITGALPPDSPVLDPLSQSGTSEPTPGMTVLLGISVFRGDRLRGFLDGLDARGYLWAVGRLHEGTVQLPHPGGGAVVFQITRVSTSITPAIRDEQLTMKVEVSADFQVEEITATGVVLGDPETIRRLSEGLRQLIEREIRDSLNVVQTAFRSDIYGFGQAVYRHKPQLWQQLKDDWNEEIFPHLPVQVEMRRLRIREPGLIIRDPGH
ncbi:MAG: Ger(x)C family spore germination protein [Bacillota bacterium]